MQAFTKDMLSGSTNGKPIKVAATATLGTTIHTAVAGTSSIDEIYVYAFNSDTVIRTLTIEWGGATVPDQSIVQSLLPNTGLALIVPGLPLNNSLLVTAFADVANKVTISGWVHHIV